MDWAPTVAIALVAALLLGCAARRAGLSPIVGYLLAGVAIGPHTPGFVGNAALAQQLADVGVVLLMFGVGLGFSLETLWSVRRVAVPGALLASSVAVLLGTLIGTAMGWELGAALVLGMALATASTVVIVRGLMDVGLLGSVAGNLTIGWSVVEDLITILLLVSLPALAAGAPGEVAVPLWQALLPTLGKVVLMGAVVFVGGGRVVPKLLALVARSQSRELFLLAVLTLALGVAYLSAAVFGVSLALGAFFAGMVVGRSDLSHQAAADALPLRDAFSVLFFVAVGMLFDPRYVLEQPLPLLGTLAIVLVAKPVVAVLFLLWRGHLPRVALGVGAGVAQVSEFSFVLAGSAVGLGLLPPAAQQLVIATALLSIMASPLLFRGVGPLDRWLSRWRPLGIFLAKRAAGLGVPPAGEGPPSGHVVLGGYGRVGSMIGGFLEQRKVPYVVVEIDRALVEQLRRRGVSALYGDAGNPVLLDRAGVHAALALVLTMPDALSRRLAVEHASLANPALPVLARVHREREAAELRGFPGVRAVHGEVELGFAMARQLLQVLGASAIEADATVLAAQGGADDVSRLRLFEVRIPAGSPVAGRSIAELGLPATVLVVAIVRQGRLVVPRGGTPIAAADALLLFAGADDARTVETAVGASAGSSATAEPPPDR